MTHREKVTIAVAYYNLKEDKPVNNQIVDQFLLGKTEDDLEEIKNELLKSFTTDQMIKAAEKFSAESNS